MTIEYIKGSLPEITHTWLGVGRHLGCSEMI